MDTQTYRNYIMANGPAVLYLKTATQLILTSLSACSSAPDDIRAAAAAAEAALPGGPV
jgi:hypothetical protein